MKKQKLSKYQKGGNTKNLSSNRPSSRELYKYSTAPVVANKKTYTPTLYPEYKTTTDSPSAYNNIYQNPNVQKNLTKRVAEQGEIQQKPKVDVKRKDLIDNYTSLLEKNVNEKAAQYYKKYTPENKEEVYAIQKELKEAGYDLGDYGPNKDGVDGMFGDKTKQAYEKHMMSKTAEPVGEIDYSDELKRKSCKVNGEAKGCAWYVSDVTKGKVLGDAWEMKNNIESSGGQIKYNIYDDPKIKNANNPKDLISATRSVKEESKATADMFAAGDVVGLFWPGSEHHQEAIDGGKGGAKNTHVGIVTTIKDGVPIISHNVNGKVIHQPYNTLNIGWVGSQSKRNIPKYEDDFNADDKSAEDAISHYAENLSKDLSISTPEGQVEKDIKGILSVESKMGELSPTEKQQKTSKALRFIRGLPSDQGSISKGAAKIKLNTFTEDEQKFLGINNENINNTSTSIKAATYLYLKNYQYFKNYASENPQLNLTDQDIRTMTILAHNQGTSKLSNFGYNKNNLGMKEELEKLRELTNTEKEINDISSSKYQYIPIVGQKLYEKKYGKEGHLPYVARVLAHGSKEDEEVETFRGGGIITDPRGQWAHPGKVTRIPSSNITMKGVNYPVLGVGSNGEQRMMYPGKDYQFNSKSVIEYPVLPQMQEGGQYFDKEGNPLIMNREAIEPDWFKYGEKPQWAKNRMHGYKFATSSMTPPMNGVNNMMVDVKGLGVTKQFPIGQNGFSIDPTLTITNVSGPGFNKISRPSLGLGLTKKFQQGGQAGGDPMLDNIYKKYPALKNMGKTTIAADPNFTSDKTGIGDIEYFRQYPYNKINPTFDMIEGNLNKYPEIRRGSVRYNNGFVAQHPDPSAKTHGIRYNPETNDEQDVMLDMLHGMRKGDKNYAKLRADFANTVLNSKYGGDFKHNFENDMEETRNLVKKQARKSGAGRKEVQKIKGLSSDEIATKYGDGKRAYLDNWIDGEIRGLMFEGTPEDFERANYWPKARDTYFKDPELKDSFTKLQEYLKTNTMPSFEQGGQFNDNNMKKKYQKGGRFSLSGGRSMHTGPYAGATLDYPNKTDMNPYARIGAGLNSQEGEAGVMIDSGYPVSPYFRTGVGYNTDKGVYSPLSLGMRFGNGAVRGTAGMSGRLNYNDKNFAGGPSVGINAGNRLRGQAEVGYDPTAKSPFVNAGLSYQIPLNKQQRMGCGSSRFKCGGKVLPKYQMAGQYGSRNYLPDMSQYDYDTGIWNGTDSGSSYGGTDNPFAGYTRQTADATGGRSFNQGMNTKALGALGIGMSTASQFIPDRQPNTGTTLNSSDGYFNDWAGAAGKGALGAAGAVTPLALNPAVMAATGGLSTLAIPAAGIIGGAVKGFQANKEARNEDEQTQKYFNAMEKESLAYQPMGTRMYKKGGQAMISPNAELEQQEGVQTPDGETFNVNGAPHEQGGIPVALEQGSKIFSDDESMALPDGRTPAQVFKQLSKKLEFYKKNAESGATLAKQTARAMISSIEKKIDELWKHQEQVKQSQGSNSEGQEEEMMGQEGNYYPEPEIVPQNTPQMKTGGKVLPKYQGGNTGIQLYGSSTDDDRINKIARNAVSRSTNPYYQSGPGKAYEPDPSEWPPTNLQTNGIDLSGQGNYGAQGVGTGQTALPIEDQIGDGYQVIPFDYAFANKFPSYRDPQTGQNIMMFPGSGQGQPPKGKVAAQSTVGGTGGARTPMSKATAVSDQSLSQLTAQLSGNINKTGNPAAPLGTKVPFTGTPSTEMFGEKKDPSSWIPYAAQAAAFGAQLFGKTPEYEKMRGRSYRPEVADPYPFLAQEQVNNRSLANQSNSAGNTMSNMLANKAGTAAALNQLYKGTADRNLTEKRAVDRDNLMVEGQNVGIANQQKDLELARQESIKQGAANLLQGVADTKLKQDYESALLANDIEKIKLLSQALLTQGVTFDDMNEFYKSVGMTADQIKQVRGGK